MAKALFYTITLPKYPRERSKHILAPVLREQRPSPPSPQLPSTSQQSKNAQQQILFSYSFDYTLNCSMFAPDNLPLLYFYQNHYISAIKITYQIQVLYRVFVIFNESIKTTASKIFQTVLMMMMMMMMIKLHF